jgi:hypothetical protein
MDTKGFIKHFSAAQFSVSEAKRGSFPEFHLKQADFRLQQAFELMPMHLQEEVLRMQSELKVLPEQPPVRKVTATD